MKIHLVRILVCWFIVPGVLLSTFPGCGKVLDREPLRVSVRIPQDDSPELFWFGVEKRSLRIESEGKESLHDWIEGSTLELDLQEGDRLIFSGTDREERVLVTGEAHVEKAKFVSIPLRRVL